MPCDWGVKAGMVHVWVAGKTVWSLVTHGPYLSTLEKYIIKHYINSTCLLHLLILLSSKLTRATVPSGYCGHVTLHITCHMYKQQQTGSQVCTQAARCEHRQTGVNTGSQVWTQADRCEHRQTGVNTGSQVCTQAARCAHRQTGVHTGRQVWTQADRCAHRQPGVYTGSQVCTHAARCAHRQPGVNTGRQVCTQAARCEHLSLIHISEPTRPY